ncbi:MAG: hypothetical protein E7534_04415 [Ruminococcaceae bacterium]|nr:hypothetical protein [Oscillospiraceae bacterium]
MNKEHLQQVFDNYIRKFEWINNPEHDENYKWRIAYQFRDLIDPDAPLFAENLKKAWKLSANLIDSSNRYCFSALIACAEKEPEAVRQLFKDLFAADYGDLSVRQQKIENFIENANALTKRLHSQNGMFMNDQRSAMAYLFLYDPDNHYLYKASEANSFAACVEFFDDWGPSSSFNLHIYHRMCDRLVEEIKNHEALVNTHNSRFYGKNGIKIDGMHPDENYHILAFDIIYGAPDFRYNFYEGLKFSTIKAHERKEHEEHVAEAQRRYVVWERAQKKYDLLAEANEFFTQHIVLDMTVTHRVNGAGVVTQIDGDRLWVLFPQKGSTVKYNTLSAFLNGFLAADIPDLQERIARYQPVLQNTCMILSGLETARKNLEPYQKYLE